MLGRITWGTSAQWKRMHGQKLSKVFGTTHIGMSVGNGAGRGGGRARIQVFITLPALTTPGLCNSPASGDTTNSAAMPCLFCGSIVSRCLCLILHSRGRLSRQITSRWWPLYRTVRRVTHGLEARSKGWQVLTDLLDSGIGGLLQDRKQGGCFLRRRQGEKKSWELWIIESTASEMI